MNGPWIVLRDNQDIIQVAQEIGDPGQAEHIELRFFAIQEVVNRDGIMSKYCSPEENAADILTKALLPHNHAKGAKALHLATLQLTEEM